MRPASTVLPSIAHLRAFEAAARLASFTRAAEELGMTQSAVSHHIRDLELHLGQALFQRGGRGVRVTAEGEALADAVREGLGRIATAVDSLRRGRDAAHVTVSAPPGLVVKWLFPRLILFDALHPGIAVDVTARQARDLERADEADVVIRYGETASVGSVLLLMERMAPVASPRLLQAQSIRRPADLGRAVLLNDELAGSAAERAGWRRWFEAAGLPRRTPPQYRRFGQANMVVDAAVDGLGVALGRSPLVAADLAAGRLAAPFGPILDTGLGYRATVTSGSRARLAVTAFLDWLVAEAAGGAPEMRTLEAAVAKGEADGRSGVI